MNKTLFAVICSTITLGAYATGETRDVPPFTEVALNGTGTVRIKQGPQSVRVSIDENLADRYVTEVINGKLNIGFKCTLKPSVLRAMKNLKSCVVDISVPDLRKIETNGECSLAVDGFTGEKLIVRATGAGKIALSGTVDALDVSCTGAVTVNAFDLIARSERASLTGAATLRTNVTESLDASISGAGTIFYRGTPHLTEKISGAGKIRKENE